MQMKKILGILLALCFLMSVTAAAVSAEPNQKFISSKKTGDKSFGNKDDNKFGNKDDNKFGNKDRRGHWMFKKSRHNKDKHHKFVWFTNDRVWHWDN
jgi:hypothetical protein